VVTSLTYRLHPIEPVITAGLLVYPVERGREVLRHLREVISRAPEHVSAFGAYLYGPEDESIPESLQGSLATMLAVCHTGPIESAEGELAELREFGPPTADHIERTTYADFQCLLDDPPGYRNYMTAEHLAELSDHAIEVIDRHARGLPRGPGWIIVVPWGGAVARPPHPTPLANRDAKWVVHPGAFWADARQGAAVFAWVRAFRADLQPHATGGAWLNWIGNEGDARVRAAFGDADFDRLRSVKAAHDPGTYSTATTTSPRSRAPCSHDGARTLPGLRPIPGCKHRCHCPEAAPIRGIHEAGAGATAPSRFGCRAGAATGSDR
jgi:hypothetical protein